MTSQHRATPEILYIVGSLDRGGTETHLSLIAPALLQKGWRSTIFCLSHRGELADLLAATGVQILGVSKLLHGTAPRSCRILLMALSAVRLWLYLVRHRPTITHFFLPASYCLGAPIALLAGARTLLMSRRSRNHYLENRPFFRWLERQLHSRMTLLLGNSRRVQTDLIEEGVAPERTRVIYNGVRFDRDWDTDLHRAHTRAALGLTDELTIICVANLIPYKGHKDLLEALAMRKSTLPQNWKLLLIGRDDGIGTKLLAQIRELDLLHHVLLLGSRTDITKLLNSADLSVLPSHEEGFSNAILEAMAAGLPVIATDVGGNAEAVVHGETGFVVPAGNPVLLGDAIEKLALEPALRKTFGDAGLKRARNLFSLESCVDSYDRLYHEIKDSKDA